MLACSPPPVMTGSCPLAVGWLGNLAPAPVSVAHLPFMAPAGGGGGVLCHQGAAVTMVVSVSMFHLF